MSIRPVRARLRLRGGPSGLALRVGGTEGGVVVAASESLLLGALDFTIDLQVKPGWLTYIYLLTGPGYSFFVDQNGHLLVYLSGDSYASLTSNATLYSFMCEGNAVPVTARRHN